MMLVDEIICCVKGCGKKLTQELKQSLASALRPRPSPVTNFLPGVTTAFSCFHDGYSSQTGHE